jgi:hypothetical protein
MKGPLPAMPILPQPSIPPSEPAALRYLGRGRNDHATRVQLSVALIAGLIMVAVPLYLWRRPPPRDRDRPLGPRRFAGHGAPTAGPLAPGRAPGHDHGRPLGGARVARRPRFPGLSSGAAWRQRHRRQGLALPQAGQLARGGRTLRSAAPLRRGARQGRARQRSLRPGDGGGGVGQLRARRRLPREESAGLGRAQRHDAAEGQRRRRLRQPLAALARLGAGAAPVREVPGGVDGHLPAGPAGRRRGRSP